jgi:hypothetical protein
MSATPYNLKYVCKYCGDAIVTYPDVPSAEPATLSVCDKHGCRMQAAGAYRRPADADRAGGRNTLTRFADRDEATP